MLREACLYQKLKKPKGAVRCLTCNHYCLISPGKRGAPPQRGICGTRENRNAKIYSLVYGQAVAENVDPIEKKPLFHFMPGTFSLSIATVGCPFQCKWCQNWQISQAPKPDKQIEGFELSPQKIVQDAIAEKCQSISYTYTEPAIFLEYALDTMKLAKKEGLKNIWVSDGYSSKEALTLVAPYLDAINVDLEAFKDETYRKYCGGRLQPVLESLKTIKKLGIHLEVTTLIIPAINDSKKELTQIAQFIKKYLGENTPWHISRFFPAYQLLNLPPTPVETLEKAYQIGKKAGLKFVYLGNVFNTEKESTFCPKCGQEIIHRENYNIKIQNLKIKSQKGFCKNCGEDLNIRL